MIDVTRLLNAIERGELQAAEKLLPLVYDELRKQPPGTTHCSNGLRDYFQKGGGFYRPGRMYEQQHA